MTTKQWIVALCAMVILAGATFAQAPNAAPATDLPITEGQSSSALLPLQTPLPVADERFWIRGEYLFGWLQGTRLPALVTTSPSGTAQSAAGVLGANGTQTLFSGMVGDNLRSGLRIEAGWVCDPERRLSIEAGFMMMGSQSTNFSSGDGFSILARPFNNVNNDNRPEAALVAFPGVATGSVDVRANSGNFYEGHIDISERSLDGGWWRLNSLIGYRAFRYDDSLQIQQSAKPTAVPFVAGTRITGTDDFSTRNDFHGLDLGLRTQFFWKNLSLDVITKLAAGRLFREVDIDGVQVVSVPGAGSVTNVGNIYALTSNIGNHTSADWKVVPEVGANLAWQVRPYLRVRFGYSALWLNGIARASDQIDTTINPNFLPPANPTLGGAPRPQFNLNTGTLCVQSINLGLELSY